MNPIRPPGRVITFYSYKGGTGRSMALANVAWILACNGKRVLTIDWDLEAPGLHRYFRPFLIDDELASSPGLINLVDKYANQAIRPVDSNAMPDPNWYLEYADFSDYKLSVDFEYFPTGGCIDLLPAGRQDKTYSILVNSFHWQDFYDRLGGGGFFETFKRKACAEYDFVLIDSRTGVSDTAGICTAQMPDSLVVCFTYNNQSIKGAAAAGRSSQNEYAKLLKQKVDTIQMSTAELQGVIVEDTPRPYRVFPVPMRVDSGESDRLEIRQAYARNSFSDLVAHLGPTVVDEYWKAVEVPHKVFYSYEEVLAPFKDEALDPKSVLAAFVRLTGYLTQLEVTEYRLPIAPDVKQKFLEAFAETPLTAKAKKELIDSRQETEEEALVRAAETAIAGLTAEEKVLAIRVFGRLVRVGREEEGGGYFPIRASVNEFDEGAKAVITKLARYGLLNIASDARPSQYKPAVVPEQTAGFSDERLLKLWKPLIGWLGGDRDFLIWRQQFRAYMIDWERSGREESARLSGRVLSEADLWFSKRIEDLNNAEIAYIEVSRRTRTSGWYPAFIDRHARFVVPALFAISLYYCAFAVLSRIETGGASAVGLVCEASKDPTSGTKSFSFETSNPCAASGKTLQKGVRYRLSIQVDEQAPWSDAGIATDLSGFSVNKMTWPMYLALPFRRWLTEPWFKPIARIGSRGDDEYVIEPSRPFAEGEPRDRLITEILARRDGELFLYVNDALLFWPGLHFYGNNQGKARVTIERVEPPPAR